MTVLSATAWPSNAEMIEDMARLGYLRDEWVTLDPTYGRGIWWKRWQPQHLVKHDKYTLDGVDFRNLPYPDNTFDAAVFDPPYVAIGGRKTSTLKPVDNSRGPHRRTREGSDFHDRYGLVDAEASPAGVQLTINTGLLEVARVVKPGGFILNKNQDYVSSGRLWPGAYLTLNHALRSGLKYIDTFDHIGGVRPQPGARRQVHGRRNISTLFVFQKRKTMRTIEFVCGCHSHSGPTLCTCRFVKPSGDVLVCTHDVHTREATPPWRGRLHEGLVGLLLSRRS